MTTVTTYPETEEVQTSTPSVPHSKEAEEAVIGSVLINPNCLYELLPFLQADAFYIHRHQWIWDVFSTLSESGVAIDTLVVGEELLRRGQLEELGGSAYLVTLLNQVPSSLNAENYGRIVHSHYVRRELIDAANKIAALGYNEGKDIDDCVSEANQKMAGLEILSVGKKNFIPLKDLLGNVYKDVERRAKDPKNVWGFATGIPKFDLKTGGLQLGELTYIVGGPGVGKTWLDLGWSVELGKQAPGVIISLEMKRLAVGRRIMSGVSGVNTRRMKSGFVDSGDFPKMEQTVREFEEHQIWLDDSSYDTQKLRSTLAWLQGEYGIKWFTLDYALLLMDSGRDETEQTKIISANMKRIVHDLNLCGTVLHSVTKIGMGNNNQPSMADQRGSGQAIHDADLQLFLTPLYEKDPSVSGLPKAQKEKMATLWCSKGRELEESRFKIHLVRKGDSPFWGEYSPMNAQRPSSQDRKDTVT